MTSVLTSILISWISGVSLALIRVLVPTLLMQQRYTLTDLWIMGIIPVALVLGSVISFLMSPLVIWAFKGSPPQHVALEAGALLACLALYMIGSSIWMVLAEHEDSNAILTFFVPLALAISSLVYVGQRH